MADLLVIVPSRGRPESLPKVVKAWQATGAFDHAELMFAIDDDDPSRDAYLAHQLPCVSIRVAPRWQPMVHKLNNAAVVRATGTSPLGGFCALAFAGDDHLPRTPGWAGRYVDELRQLGTGIVYGDDGYQGERLPTQWAMTVDIVRALGRMVPAPVEHLYCDNSVLDLGRAAGCIRYLPDVLVEHMHPVAGKAVDDDQYRRVNSGDQYARDGRAYRRWLRSGLRVDAARVRELRR
ncbi:hypothetical protein [Micromonospora carbonacea]|uniref:Glycosyltransferase n=1 Tax=Micromonospora carbonacea TaxID=47853 RepID=A0A1C4X031_9ACTN|nr:hypothetical protein [Micromonospora carbonacea]SCF01481.1 hypothetical protein GA0070563_104124 [Micromonospora carbonacea]